MSLVESYVKSVRRHARMHAMYPPSTDLKIGDVFTFEDGVYQRVFRLSDEEIAFETSHGTLGEWQSKSDDGTSFDLAIDGTLPDGTPVSTIGEGEVGAVVKLKGERSYAASMTGVSVETLENLRSLKKLIASRFRHGEWDTSYIVVTEVWQAEHTTLIAGSGTETAVELKAKANVKPADVTLAKIAATCGVTTAGTASMTIDGDAGLVPFFRGYKFSLLDILKATNEVDPSDLVMIEWEPALEA